MTPWTFSWTASWVVIISLGGICLFGVVLRIIDWRDQRRAARLNELRAQHGEEGFQFYMACRDEAQRRRVDVWQVAYERARDRVIAAEAERDQLLNLVANMRAARKREDVLH